MNVSRTVFIAAVVVAGPALAAAPAAEHELSEVIVTGAPYAVSIGSTTTSIDVMKREEIDQAPAAGLGDVLAHVPGVRSSFFGPGASRPVIRGLAGPRVMVLTNGIGMIDASGLSPDHQVASDPQEAERIEVLRGPSALAYGGSAIGGVVNVIDDRIPDAYAAGLHGRGLASGSSVDDGKQVSGGLKLGVGGRWMLTADGVHRRTQDYDVPVDPVSGRLAARQGLPAPLRRAATVPNSWVELDAYGVGASYVGDGAWGGLAAKRTQSSYGSPVEQDVHIALEQTRLDARGGGDVDWGVFDRLKVAAGWADYTHTEFEGASPGTTYLSDGFEGRLELVQRDRDGWQGAVGVQGLRRNFDAIGDEALIPRTRITELGGFVLQRLDRDGWGVEGGLRFDHRKLDSLAGLREFSNVSGSVGAFVRPAQGWFLGLSATRTSRAPTEEELFSFGPHPATAAFEVGDDTLGREVSNSLEASVHYGVAPWTVDLHLFYVDYESFIDLVPTGVVDADSGFQVFNFAQTGAAFHGMETEATLKVWQDGLKSFRLEGAADYVHGETDLGPAARIPPWSVTGRGVFEGGWWTGSLELRRVGGQDDVAAHEIPTDGYALLNASLVLRPLKSNEDFKLFIDGRNLTDAEAREHASFLKDIAPMPGRSVRVGVGYRF